LHGMHLKIGGKVPRPVHEKRCIGTSMWKTDQANTDTAPARITQEPRCGGSSQHR
jgi:hypothetical protein